ncbi:TRIC cation channel family protein [Microbacterium sp. X-17]|uniref:trimeric intracellular cation channel family protein n=1 Tax=Microbacterium sp. X-17 TaxID=3144404 RepID=UPI0031F4CDED
MNDATLVIPLWADLTAVSIGGIEGAMFASRFRGVRRLDLLGVVIIGILIGMGGGLIRDLLLGVPPASLQSEWYLVAATTAALAGMLLAGALSRVSFLIVALDALAIGMFGAFGTSKALTLGLPVVPAIFVGVCAAVGGSVLRDVIMGLPVAVMHVGSLYAVAAGGGCLALVILHAVGVPIIWAAVACILVTAAIRLMSVIFDVSLPEQRALARRRAAGPDPAE